MIIMIIELAKIVSKISEEDLYKADRLVKASNVVVSACMCALDFS